MNWASIERDVALRTESRSFRSVDLDASLRSGNVSRLIDGILSSRLLADDKPTKEEQKLAYEDGGHANPVLVKSLLADIAEVQTALRRQASKVEQIGTVHERRENDVSQVRKSLDALFDRVNQLEAAHQGKPSDADVVELYNDIQIRLKRVETNVDGLEENTRSYTVQFATKEAFSKLLDTLFDQLKSLSATVEASKLECTHATVLFDALASSFVMLNGDDSSHQLDLVTTFSREINRDHLSRILTDALMRSLDGSIQAHLKPAMGVMHASLIDVIEELRQKQDAALSSMRNRFQMLARQVQEDRSSALLMPLHNAQDPKLDANFMAEFKQMKDAMDILSADNKALRASMESQSAIVAQLVTTQETTQTIDAGAVLTLRSRCDDLDREVFALKQDNSAVREIASAAQAVAEETSAHLQDTEERVTVLNSEVHEKLEHVEGELRTTLSQVNATLAGKADSAVVDALRTEAKAAAGRLASLESSAATKDDVDAVQSKLDVVSSDLNILQGDQTASDKRATLRLKAHDEELTDLRRQGVENADAAVKLTKRFDLYESTAQGKLSNLGTELHHKVAEASESVGRLARRFDTLDADAQAKNVSLREAQAKVQGHAEALSELTRKLTLLDSSCSSQFSSSASQQKSLQEEVADFTNKVTRKLDLHEAELISKFNIRNDRVDALLMQNQESISKLGDRVELSEHKQAALLDELSSELRGKVTGAVDLTAQLNRRLESYQGELTGRLTALQSEVNTLNKATNERINAAIKQTDVNLELLQTQLTTKQTELAHKVSSVGDSLAHLAQQQFELSGLQEKQQMDFNTLGSDLAGVRAKLEEKLASTEKSLQTTLTQHGKAHTSALAESKYDLLQLTSRVSLLEQLIRYGQDLEDQTLASSAVHVLGSASGDSKAGSPRGSSLGPRPADPDLRARVAELRLTVESLSAEFLSQRAEADSQLDAFKVGLAALRKQYEEEVQEIRETQEDQQRMVNRCVLLIYRSRITYGILAFYVSGVTVAMVSVLL
jgi:hypothetical protein